MILHILYKVIPYLDIAAPLAALLFACYRKERKLGEHFYILVYLCTQLALNTWGKLIMLLVKPNPNNLFLYQINSFASFVIISLYYFAKWKPYLDKKRLYILYTYFLIFILLILAIIWQEDPEAYNSRSASLVSLLICIYTSMYYYSKLNNPEIENITATRSFWFTTGFFLYYGGSFFIVSSYKLLSQVNNSKFSMLWLVHNIIFAMMCILFSIGFRCKRSQQI
ncbi:hypothetical protein D3H65_24970 [Paraflavitalea soli]|uniref:Uncharacterized protein n=1 Tax=Paraflavitalea soli TaxID=2315862 RepID=A0A3B7MSC1_9BACT|nr:hypothetical protein [Paraflavitalea soli]AXY77038.1 hypothetical protein D3H65_24970 [Paraflavitalea soli]